MIPIERRRSKLSHNENSGKRGHRRLSGSPEEVAVVVIVSVEVVVPEPGVTLAGENEHEASPGNPEHASETEFVNGPKSEPTDMVSVAACPGFTVKLNCAPSRLKSVTMILAGGLNAVIPPL
jgi:hypothetical protein